MTPKQRDRIVKAAMRLYNSPRSGLRFPPYGYCAMSGPYWQLWKRNRAVLDFRNACAAANRGRKGRSRG